LFTSAEFSGGMVYFGNVEFSGGNVRFSGARFSGSEVYFSLGQFSGSQIDFGDAEDWSFPPDFPWTGMPPSGVRLPTSETA
jgi:hypothetical protein